MLDTPRIRTAMKLMGRRLMALQQSTTRTVSSVILVAVLIALAACGSDGELKRQDLSVLHPDKCPGGDASGGRSCYQERDTKK